MSLQALSNTSSMSFSISKELATKLGLASPSSSIKPARVQNVLYHLIAASEVETDEMQHTDRLAREILNNDQLINGVDLNIKYTPKNYTLLMMACYRGKIGCIEKLLQHGAQRSLYSIAGNTAVVFAALNKQLEPSRRVAVADLLRKYGADFEEQLFWPSYDQYLSPLERVLAKEGLSPDSIQTAQRFIEMGADINKRGRHDGLTALERAYARNAYDWLETLIMLGANVTASVRLTYTTFERAKQYLYSKKTTPQNPESILYSPEHLTFLKKHGLKPAALDPNVLHFLESKAAHQIHDLTNVNSQDLFELLLVLGYPVTAGAVVNYYRLGAEPAKFDFVLSQMPWLSLEQLDQWIRSGKPLSARDDFPPLKTDEKKLLVLLIERTIAFITKDIASEMLIHASSEHSQVEVLAALLKKGACANFKNPDNRSIFSIIPAGNTAFEVARRNHQKENYHFLYEATWKQLDEVLFKETRLIPELAKLIGEYSGLLPLSYEFSELEKENLRIEEEKRQQKLQQWQEDSIWV